MKPGNLYKHLNNTDVAFAPESVQQSSEVLRVLGTWINVVNPKKSFPIGADCIDIKLKDLPKWELFETK